MTKNCLVISETKYIARDPTELWGVSSGFLIAVRPTGDSSNTAPVSTAGSVVDGVSVGVGVRLFV